MSVYQLRKVWDEEVLAPDTYRRAVDISGLSDLSFRWVQHEVAAQADAATIAFIPSEFPEGRPEIAETDPANNPYLKIDPTAGFFSNPGDAEGCDFVTLSNNGWATMIIEVTVVAALPKFSFIVGGRRAA